MSACTQRYTINRKRFIEAINAINACFPEESGVQSITHNRVNSCSTLEDVEAVYALQLYKALCWIAAGNVDNCEWPDSCPCYIINYPSVSGSIALWDPFMQCATVPDTVLINGSLTTNASGVYDDRGGNMPFFTSLTLEKVTLINGYVYIAFQEQLLTFAAPELLRVAGNFQVGSNASQITHYLPKIQQVDGDWITSGTLATELLVPTLTTVGGVLMSIGGLALRVVDISGLVNFTGSFECVNADLSEDSVNGILIQLDTGCNLSGAVNVLLDGNTSAAPTGLGIVAMNNLLGRGVNVVVNP